MKYEHRLIRYESLDLPNYRLFAHITGGVKLNIVFVILYILDIFACFFFLAYVCTMHTLQKALQKYCFFPREKNIHK